MCQKMEQSSCAYAAKSEPRYGGQRVRNLVYHPAASENGTVWLTKTLTPPLQWEISQLPGLILL